MLHLVIGRQGSGKTLFIVKKAYEGYLAGKTVYSNVHLKFPYKELDYNDVINCRLKNAIVILDEIHLLLPARGSAMNKMSRIICDTFISQIRKAGLEVWGTTQMERKVDIRIREEKDYVYLCSRYAFINGEWSEVKHSNSFDVSIPIIIKLEAQEQYSGEWINFFMYGNNIFELFDSTQIIQVKGLEG